MLIVLFFGGRALTVDKLGENKVLIILCNKDMEDYSIDFVGNNLYDSDLRKSLIKIMKLGCSKAGVEICNRNIDIEALPFEDECYILITVYEKIRRSYRMKDTGECVCYSLGGSGNFLDTLEKLYRLNVCCNRNSAYLYDESYYIVFEYPSIPKKLKRLLSEYGKRKMNRIETARIRENGRLICSHNAILQIGKHLV